LKIEDYPLMIWLALAGLTLASIPFFMALIIYRTIKHRGKTAENIGIALIVMSILATLFGLYQIFFGPSGFGPDYDKAEIQQNIGGMLICSSVHTADYQEFQHDVSYAYKPADSSHPVHIGTGTYWKRSRGKDEQIIRYRNWMILKTGGAGDFDRVIIGDARSNQWKEYDLNEESIVRDPLWKRLHSQPRSEKWCSESFVTKIENGLIHVHYKFTRPEPNEGSYGHKDIVYIIDEQTGQLIMTDIR
jgi:hypothetical protein